MAVSQWPSNAPSQCATHNEGTSHNRRPRQDTQRESAYHHCGRKPRVPPMVGFPTSPVAIQPPGLQCRPGREGPARPGPTCTCQARGRRKFFADHHQSSRGPHHLKLRSLALTTHHHSTTTTTLVPNPSFISNNNIIPNLQLDYYQGGPGQYARRGQGPTP